MEIEIIMPGRSQLVSPETSCQTHSHALLGPQAPPRDSVLDIIISSFGNDDVSACVGVCVCACVCLL